MDNQTAIDWLRQAINKKLNNELSPYFVDLFDNAKAMEKEQMDKVSEDWFVEGCSHMKDNKRIYQSFEQYYNETYG
jgi:disulfide oxidoreductase YuzD